MGCLLSRAQSQTSTLFGRHCDDRTYTGATRSNRTGKGWASRRRAPSMDAAQSPVDALLRQAEPGEMALLDERHIRAALQNSAQPVVVLTVPLLEPVGDNVDHVSGQLDTLFIAPVGYDPRLEEHAPGQATFRLSLSGDARSLLMSTDQGATSLHCVLANRAALRALGLESEKEVLGFLARSFRSDRGLVSLFQDAVKRLLAGHLTTTKHFVPGDFGRDRYFLSLRISPFAFQSSGTGGNGVNATGASGVAATEVGSGSNGGSGGGLSSGGSIFPGMLLELDVPYEGKELAARLQRDYMILSNIPSMVTIFDMNGHVLHQNRASVGYMGHLVGQGLSMRQPGPASQPAPEPGSQNSGKKRKPPGRLGCRACFAILRFKGDTSKENEPAKQSSQLLSPQAVVASPQPLVHAMSSTLASATLLQKAQSLVRGEWAPSDIAPDHWDMACWSQPAAHVAAMPVLQRLFVMDPNKLVTVMAALGEGKEWRGLVRMPRTLLRNHDEHEEDGGDNNGGERGGEGAQEAEDHRGWQQATSDGNATSLGQSLSSCTASPRALQHSPGLSTSHTGMGFTQCTCTQTEVLVPVLSNTVGKSGVVALNAQQLLSVAETAGDNLNGQLQLQQQQQLPQRQPQSSRNPQLRRVSRCQSTSSILQQLRAAVRQPMQSTHSPQPLPSSSSSQPHRRQSQMMALKPLTPTQQQQQNQERQTPGPPPPPPQQQQQEAVSIASGAGSSSQRRLTGEAFGRGVSPGGGSRPAGDFLVANRLLPGRGEREAAARTAPVAADLRVADTVHSVRPQQGSNGCRMEPHVCSTYGEKEGQTDEQTDVQAAVAVRARGSNLFQLSIDSSVGTPSASPSVLAHLNQESDPFALQNVSYNNPGPSDTIASSLSGTGTIATEPSLINSSMASGANNASRRVPSLNPEAVVQSAALVLLIDTVGSLDAPLAAADGVKNVEDLTGGPIINVSATGKKRGDGTVAKVGGACGGGVHSNPWCGDCESGAMANNSTQATREGVTAQRPPSLLMPSNCRIQQQQQQQRWSPSSTPSSSVQQRQRRNQQTLQLSQPLLPVRQICPKEQMMCQPEPLPSGCAADNTSSHILKKSSMNVSAVQEAWYEEFPTTPLELVTQGSRPLSARQSAAVPRVQTSDLVRRSGNTGLGHHNIDTQSQDSCNNQYGDDMEFSGKALSYGALDTDGDDDDTDDSNGTADDTVTYPNAESSSKKGEVVADPGLAGAPSKGCSNRTSLWDSGHATAMLPGPPAVILTVAPPGFPKLPPLSSSHRLQQQEDNEAQGSKQSLLRKLVSQDQAGLDAASAGRRVHRYSTGTDDDIRAGGCVSGFEPPRFGWESPHHRAPVVPNSNSSIPKPILPDAAPTPSPSLVGGASHGSAPAASLRPDAAIPPPYGSMASIQNLHESATARLLATRGSQLSKLMLDVGSASGSGVDSSTLRQDLVLLATGSVSALAQPVGLNMITTHGTLNGYTILPNGGMSTRDACSTLPHSISSDCDPGRNMAAAILPSFWIQTGSTAGLTVAAMAVPGSGVFNPASLGAAAAACTGIQAATGPVGPTAFQAALAAATTGVPVAAPSWQRPPCSRFRLSQLSDSREPPSAGCSSVPGCCNNMSLATCQSGESTCHLEGHTGANAVLVGRSSVSDIVSDEQNAQLPPTPELPPASLESAKRGITGASTTAAVVQTGQTAAAVMAAGHTASVGICRSLLSRAKSDLRDETKILQRNLSLREARLPPARYGTGPKGAQSAPRSAGGYTTTAAAGFAIASGAVSPSVIMAPGGGAQSPGIVGISGGGGTGGGNNWSRGFRSSFHNFITAGSGVKCSHFSFSQMTRAAFPSSSHNHHNHHHHHHQDPRARMRAMLRSVLIAGGGGSSNVGVALQYGGSRSRSSLSSLYSNRSISRAQPYLSSFVPPGDEFSQWLDPGANKRMPDGFQGDSLTNTPVRGSGERVLMGCDGVTASSLPQSAAAVTAAQQLLPPQPQQPSAVCTANPVNGNSVLSGVTDAEPALNFMSTTTSFSRGSPGAAADGDVRWHEVHVKPVDDPISGERVLLVIQTDISNQIRAEEVLTQVLEAEQRLLADIFPRHVVRHMTAARNTTATRQRNGLQLLRHIQDPAAVATSHECITVLFADIKGFTEMCKEVAPATVMTFLNDLYTRLDSLTDVYGVYKVETIGDCYMVAGGLMARDEDGYGQAVRTREDADPLHATRVVAFARAMLGEAARVRLPNTGKRVQMRIGIHSGPATSGVVGQKMPRFCLFGDTVNTASRMESTSLPGCIHVSGATKELLKAGEEAIGWAATGGVEVKGKGRMETYLWAPQSEEATRQRRDMKQRAMVLGTLPDIHDALAACGAEEAEAEAAAVVTLAASAAAAASVSFAAAAVAASAKAAAAETSSTAITSTAAASTTGCGGLLSAISEVTSITESLASGKQDGIASGRGGATPAANKAPLPVTAAVRNHLLSDVLRRKHGAPRDVFDKPRDSLVRTYSAMDLSVSCDSAVPSGGHSRRRPDRN